MLNARYSNDIISNSKEKTEDYKDHSRLNEWKIAVYALCFSLFVITAKILNANSKFACFHNLTFRN